MKTPLSTLQHSARCFIIGARTKAPAGDAIKHRPEVQAVYVSMNNCEASF